MKTHVAHVDACPKYHHTGIILHTRDSKTIVHVFIFCTENIVTAYNLIPKGASGKFNVCKVLWSSVYWDSVVRI
jgi:hypothetical protein